MKNILFFIILLSLMFSSCQQKTKKYSFPFQNPDLPVDERVKDLLSRLTLEQKVKLMVFASDSIPELGIPQYNWWNEGLHGVARSGLATVFPQSIGLAATFDEDLMFKITTAISDEARAKHHHYIKQNKRHIYQGLTYWSPTINIFRDPRWGRGMETFGEDPYLTSRMAVKFVQGFQGNDEKYLKLVATPKHFAVHSGPEPDRHTFDVRVSNYDLWNTYFPAFRASIEEGKAYSVMCAYNRYAGDPCCGSSFLLQDVLRKQWGFQGYVVSDCGAIDDFHKNHKTSRNVEEASATGVKSGTDLCCGFEYKSLVEAVKQGLITEKEIDVSLSRLLKARFLLGMFDPEERVPYSKYSIDIINKHQNHQLAVEAALKSIVLLKNQNNTLPLKKDLKKVAVIGPNANDWRVMMGNYCGFPTKRITPLEAIQKKLPGATVLYEKGCDHVYYEPTNKLLQGSGLQAIPETMLFQDKEGKKPGLVAKYYKSSEIEGEPLYTQVDKNIDFEWGEQYPEKIGDEKFSVVWEGYFIPNESGIFKIGVEAYNKAKLFIDDSLFIDVSLFHDFVGFFRSINLQKNRPYKIRYELRHRERYALARLVYEAPSNAANPKRAIEIAKESDVVIAFMGLSPFLEGEEMDVPVKGFHGGDRTSLDLPEPQISLLKQLKATGKPIILVLMSGSALAINWCDENIPAILQAWYPGQGGAEAIADILFGDYNPSAKLPVTFYKSEKQLPPFTEYSMKNRTYRYFKDKPLYPFGYGLSYTEFKIDNIKSSSTEFVRGGKITISVDIQNIGQREGEEKLQLYVKQLNAPEERPLKELRGIKTVFLKPNEKQTVNFEVSDKTLSYFDGEKRKDIIDSGTYEIYISNSSDLTKANKVVINVK